MVLFKSLLSRTRRNWLEKLQSSNSSEDGHKLTEEPQFSCRGQDRYLLWLILLMLTSSYFRLRRFRNLIYRKYDIQNLDKPFDNDSKKGTNFVTKTLAVKAALVVPSCVDVIKKKVIRWEFIFTYVDDCIHHRVNSSKRFSWPGLACALSLAF